MKNILTLIIIGFVVFCGSLVLKSGLFNKQNTRQQPCITLQQATNEDQISQPNEPVQELKPMNTVLFGVDNAETKIITIGAADANTEDPETGFKFQLRLTSKGAAIKKAIFSNGNNKGFDDRDYKNPRPLVILSPVNRNGKEIFSMANTNFVFLDHRLQLPLDKLNWKSSEIILEENRTQRVSFEALIKDKTTNQPIIKLVKTYRITPKSYLFQCDITVENLSAGEQKIQFNLSGTTGLDREGVRGDMRKVVAGFMNPKGQITSDRLDVRKLKKAKNIDQLRLVHNNDALLWVASVNKYFAAIVVPQSNRDNQFCNWLDDKTGWYSNPNKNKNNDTEEESVGFDLKLKPKLLSPAKQTESMENYNFKIYLGPKDKRFFDKNEEYKNLGFVQTIDFLACCCPAAVINPLAFTILAIMEWMYGFIGNYGVVIIILVFLIRLCLHPITKKSQVSMNKMTKLAPMTAELKKKYGNNKAELNKHVMQLYKDQGASPIMGFLPMLVQMPIWISLYSAIYASIALRGAAFLPFWITDLSAPDALVRFSTLTIPIFGWNIDSFNLLPILMGVAFYLQQKLMPKQATSADSQMAQQQKMMMFMMPIMFPLMLYKAPSGLNLYIMASTFAGVIEQYVIKKHIKEKEQAEATGLVSATSKTGGKIKRKKPKPFFFKSH